MLYFQLGGSALVAFLVLLLAMPIQVHQPLAGRRMKCHKFESVHLTVFRTPCRFSVVGRRSATSY